jgi:hypothetical protein
MWFIEYKIPKEIVPEMSFLKYYSNKYSQVDEDGINAREFSSKPLEQSLVILFV